MKLNKVFLGLSLTLAVASFANADQGHGEVKFKGAIIDAPCSIAPESQNQEVDFGLLSANELKKGGSSSKQFFNIKLLQCDATATTVTATFNGAAANGKSEWFALSGNTSQAGIVLTNADNSPIAPNSSSTLKIVEGNNTLNFGAWVEGFPVVSPTENTIVPGAFESLMTWTLAYS